jgi:toxin ParE1/3/4
MAHYRLTQLAQKDIQSIWEYTVEQSSVSQADKYIDGLLACFELIAKGTTQGISINFIRHGYKKTLYGRHIEIIRVLHASMDIESRLADE